MAALTAKERLTRAARGQEVDHIPTIGGWMNGPRNLAALAGITVEQYLADPRRGVVALILCQFFTEGSAPVVMASPIT